MNSKKRTLIIAAVAAVAALAVLLALMLRSPGTRGPLDPLEMMSTRCDAAVVIPDLGRLGERLATLPRLRLAELAASLNGFSSADAFIGELSRAAGIDIRSRESILAVGVDPARPLVVYKPETGGLLAAVPLADPVKLEGFLVRHAEVRLAAKKKGSVDVAGQTVTTWSAEGSPDPALGYGTVGGYLLVGSGKAGLETLKAALAQPPETSLARDARFAAVRRQLESGEAFAFTCGGSAQAKQVARNVEPLVAGASLLASSLPYGAGAGLWISSSEIKLSLVVPLTEAQAASLKSLGEPGGADLLAKLDPKAFLVARLGLDPKVVAPVARDFTPRLVKRALQEAGIDPSEALGMLEPGAALSLSLAPTADLGTTPALDFARTNPFKYVQLQALGRTPQLDKARELFERLPPISERFGATIAQAELAGTKAYTFNYHLGEGGSFALKDGYVAVTGGAGQMQALLERLGQPAPPQPAPEDAALAKGGLALRLDIKRLAASVRELPDSAYGIGGFAIKPAVERWLSAIEEITTLRLGATVAEGALKADLVLTLQPATQASKEPGR